jgi:hypothetical protein
MMVGDVAEGRRWPREVNISFARKVRLHVITTDRPPFCCLATLLLFEVIAIIYLNNNLVIGLCPNSVDALHCCPFLNTSAFNSFVPGLGGGKEKRAYRLFRPLLSFLNNAERE